MNEAFNGQIVPALGQWQGALLIAVAIVVGYVVRWFQRVHRLAL
jgi:hypothetical protein